MNRIITLPVIEQALDLAQQCVELDCLGVMAGPPGVGKTVALRNVAERFASLGLHGACVYYRAFNTEGSARGVKDLIDTFGGRGNRIPKGASLQVVSKIAHREFQTRNIRLLLVDEADSWTGEALRGFVSMIDATRGTPHPVSAIFAGGPELPQMIGRHRPTHSRTLRIDLVNCLPADLTLGVLRQWGEPFDRLATAIKSDDRGARAMAKRIFKGTEGNLRRLNFFARLFLLAHSNDEVTPERIEAVFSKMMRGDQSW